MKNRFPLALIVLFLISPGLFAQSATSQAADLTAIRAQIDALRTDYDKKIQDLQKQLDAIQSRHLTIDQCKINRLSGGGSG